MNALDRTIIKIGMIALGICALGVLGVDAPMLRKGPPPVHVTLRRAPVCVPGAPAAPAAALRGDPDRIVPVPSPCVQPPSDRDAASALRRLRADLQRIQVLKEAARKPRP